MSFGLTTCVRTLAIISHHQPSRIISGTQKRFLIGQASQTLTHLQSFNYHFSSTSHRQSKIIDQVNTIKPPSSCPTCGVKIETNFNLTSHIDEKCKCLDCRAFLPPQLVIKGAKSQPSAKSDQMDDEEEGENSRRKFLIDYFKLFEIEKKFIGLDFLKLKKSYHLWQQIVHPDFSQHHNSSDHPTTLSLKFMKDWSAEINRAKEILSGDFTRAEYLIELHTNIKLADETEPLDDMTLLMEIMETRERLESVQNQAELESIHLSNQKSIQEILFLLDSMFNKLIHNHAIDGELKRSMIRFKYLENIQKTISLHPFNNLN